MATRKFNLERWQTFWMLHGLPPELKDLPLLPKRVMVRRLHECRALPSEPLLRAALASIGAGDILGRLTRFRKGIATESRMAAWTMPVGTVPIAVFDPPYPYAVQSFAKQVQNSGVSDARIWVGKEEPFTPNGGFLLRAGDTFQFVISVAVPIFAQADQATFIQVFGQEIVWARRAKKWAGFPSLAARSPSK